MDFMFFVITAFLLFVLGAHAQIAPSSFPDSYPGKPEGDFSTNWQKYYEIEEALPGVNFPVTRSFAGNIPVNRANHPNCSLFFWAVEKQNGSLTDEGSTEPWIIWLNGGPGSSSLYGLFFENGPIHITSNYSLVSNQFAWSNLADTIWIDQPVGTGFSTADSLGYVPNEDQMSEDFLQFLSNLVKIFPSLIKRPLHLIGESYAGVYIPYITKALFSSTQPPVSLRKLAIGDGAIASLDVATDLPTVSVIETYPQLINFDLEVYNYFKSQAHLCKHDINLTYPQNGLLPSVITAPAVNGIERTTTELYRLKGILKKFQPQNFPLDMHNMHKNKRQSEQPIGGTLTGRINGSIDSRYGCGSFSMLVEYAHNFTSPWSSGGFDVYDIPDALSPGAPTDATVFLNGNLFMHPQAKIGNCHLDIPSQPVTCPLVRMAAIDSEIPVSNLWSSFLNFSQTLRGTT